MRVPDWLARYEAGQHREVWSELRALGADVRSNPESSAETQAVCDAMARRALSNIELIVERLTAQGYRFHTNDDEQVEVVPHRRPGAHASVVLAWLENQFSAIPFTVSSWLRIVGDVWLVGTHPRWANSADADPLVIEFEGSRSLGDESMVGYFASEFEAYQEMVDEGEGEGPFVLPIAPDRLHKANVSGGPPYGILLPDASAEGMFAAETDFHFVDYLNDVFANGGFLDAADEGVPADLLAELTSDLNVL